MQLTPRYGTDPIIVLDGSPSAIVGPAIRQRQRLATALASFTDDQWAHPSRCEGWSARDVIVHLDSTNSFWAFSAAEGLRGEPTQFLATFDPVASPAQLVASTSDVSVGDVLERFTASTAAFVGLLASLDDDGLTSLAEAPPGHISISALAHHALWDSWVHERDILIPLGIEPDEEPDEIAACLRYAAGLAPAFGIANGCGERGTLVVDVSEPDLRVVVEIGDRVVVHDGDGDADLRLTGDAVELLEALSIRRPLGQPIPAEVAWMFRGLSEIFDVPAG